MRLLIRDFLTPARRQAFARTLADIDAPTLIAWGRHDGLLPLRNAYRGVEALPGAQLVIFDDSAHVPMLEQPEAFNQRVAAFLSNDGRPGPG